MGRFAENAREPAAGQLRQRLMDLWGEGRPWRPVPDHGIAAAAVVGFRARPGCEPRAVDALQDQAEAAGCHLVLTSPWAAGEAAELVLFPTRDKLAVVAATGTEGANYGVRTADVVAWLAGLDRENPLALRYCGHDLVGGAFRGPVKAARKWAGRAAEVCPPVLDEDVGTVEALARVLKEGRTLLLRWD